MKLFQIACAVAEHDRYSPTMTLLIDKLSTMKRAELSKLRFSQVGAMFTILTGLDSSDVTSAVEENCLVPTSSGES